MTQLKDWARRQPDKPAGIVAETGETLTYATLDSRSARLAAYLVERGLPSGAAAAILMGNSLRYYEVCWAARRAGLCFTPISTHLKPAEVQYILEDSGASFLFVSSDHLPLLREMRHDVVDRLDIMVVDAVSDDSTDVSYERIADAAAPVPELPDRPAGKDLLYSSGTTGRPKGICQPLQLTPEQVRALNGWVSYFNFSFNPQTVYLSLAPLYHAAPLRSSLRCQSNGGSVILMRRFDPVGCLHAIQRYQVTHSQWVPTMFARMLALPKEVRDTFDLSSMQCAVHAAAPCPVHMKLQMLEWWGPIIWEYYSGSERNGATAISPQDWLTHRGSVGRAVLGKLHIVDEQGNECPPGLEGQVYFSDGPKFAYHNDPEKTAGAYNDKGWSTIGDVGYVDAEGFLYLTDRRANMIISGGVNIYPQEIENLLLTHPAVVDVAVVGVPNAEYGEEVKAVVQLKDSAAASAELERELIDFCRASLSHIKCPRSVDFEFKLPRADTGKLLKRVIRDRYRVGAAV